MLFNEWYAVLKDENDLNWNVGSMYEAEAIKIAKNSKLYDQNKVRIAHFHLDYVPIPLEIFSPNNPDSHQDYNPYDHIYYFL